MEKQRMTLHTLRVENGSSHCTTPSDPNMVPVKIGCFQVNPASKRGRRVFLLQMLVVCFVPHVALLMQNCSIMAQLSTTLDSALYLDTEVFLSRNPINTFDMVNMILTLGDFIISLQDERYFITEYLLSSPTPDKYMLQLAFSSTDESLQQIPKYVFQENHMITLYHFREDLLNIEDLKKTDSYKRIGIYEDINAMLLLYVAKHAKATKSSLWRQMSAASELLKTMEELSLTFCTTYFWVSEGDQTLTAIRRHHDFSIASLVSTIQYLEVERLGDDVSALNEVIKFLDDLKHLTLNASSSELRLTSDVERRVDQWQMFTKKMTHVKNNVWNVVRESAGNVVWLARRTLAIGVAILVLVLLASPVMILLLRHIACTIQTFTHSIELSTQQLIAEKQKSDLLLSRMLPLPVLRNLRAQRTVPAEAFDAVTIFFSDIVGFTTISASSTPMEVINMLNMLYRLFDEKITHYNVYKVETIGDAYMVVSGLPQRNGNHHASEIADMSLSLMRSLDGAKVPHRPDEPLMIRAGVNTGPCVAGVVGTTMPRYCLFGDTINTASRMESTGEPMKIHISYTTKKALEELGDYKMQTRGCLDIAGKGNMETYWLLGKVGELRDESPRGPQLQDYEHNLMELLIRS